MKLSKSSRLSITGLATAALLSTAIIPTGASAASTTGGTVYFASNSSTLTPAAKSTLNSLKSKIAASDKLTATGYIRNHSNNGRTVALARANAVKNYLVSIGVKATIDVADGGVPKIGGSIDSADNVTITKSTYTISAEMISTSQTANLTGSFCTGVSAKAQLIPTKGGTTYSKTAKGTWYATSKLCSFSASITGKFTGTYKAKITFTDSSKAKILRYFILGDGTITYGDDSGDFTRTWPDYDTVIVEAKNPANPLAGFGGSAIDQSLSVNLVRKR